MSYTPDYLYFIAQDRDMQIRFMKYGNSTTNLILEYSSDKNTWNSLDLTEDNEFDELPVIRLPANTPIYFRGINRTISESTTIVLHPLIETAGYSVHEVWCGGNINTLLDYTLDVNSIPSYCFYSFFYGSSYLRSAPLMPATTVAAYAYYKMFSRSGIYEAPQLPATNLSLYCYYLMFQDCTSLIVAPMLPALGLLAYCYAYMFSGCTALKLPGLMRPNTYIERFSCYYMYSGCTSLLTIPNLLNCTIMGLEGCRAMFWNCSSLIIRTSSTSAASESFTTPKLLNSPSNPMLDMFRYTSTSSNVSTPSANTRYYVTHSQTYLNEWECIYLINIGNNTNTISFSSASLPSGSLEFFIAKNHKLTNDTITVSGTTTTIATLAPNDIILLRGSALNGTPTIDYKNQLIASVSSGDISPMIAGGNLRYYYNGTTLPNYAAYKLFQGLTTLKQGPKIENANGTYSCLRTFYGCTGLIQAPTFVHTDNALPEGVFREMFYGCTGLCTIPLELTYTALGIASYLLMFEGCTNIKFAPEIAATTLAGSTCKQMFKNCTSLILPPSALYSSVLDTLCYTAMFSGCTSLINSPLIYADSITSGASACMSAMFTNCSSLTTLHTLPILNLAYSIYYEMYKGCTGILLSTTPDSLYTTPYKIPSIGTPTYIGSNCVANMFTGTGGTFTGTPALETVYYTSNAVKSILFIADEATDDNIGQCIHRTITMSNIPSNYTLTAQATCNGITETLTGLSGAVGTAINFTNIYPTSYSYTVVYSVYDGSTLVHTFSAVTGLTKLPYTGSVPITLYNVTMNSFAFQIPAATLSGNYDVTCTCTGQNPITYSWSNTGPLLFLFTGLNSNATYTYKIDISDHNGATFYNGANNTVTTLARAYLTYNLDTTTNNAHKGFYNLSFAETSPRYRTILEIYYDNNKYLYLDAGILTGDVTFTILQCMPLVVDGSSHEYKAIAKLYDPNTTISDPSNPPTALEDIIIRYTPLAYNFACTAYTAGCDGRTVVFRFYQGYSNNLTHNIIFTNFPLTDTTISAGLQTLDITGTADKYNKSYEGSCNVYYLNLLIGTTTLNYTSPKGATIGRHPNEEAETVDIYLTNLWSSSGVSDIKTVHYTIASQSPLGVDEPVNPSATFPGRHTFTQMVPSLTYTLSYVLKDISDNVLQDSIDVLVTSADFIMNDVPTITKSYDSLTITPTDIVAGSLNYYFVYSCNGTSVTNWLTSQTTVESATFNALTPGSSYPYTINVYYKYLSDPAILVKIISGTATTKEPITLFSEHTATSVGVYTTTNNYFPVLTSVVYNLYADSAHQTLIESKTCAIDPQDAKIAYATFTNLLPLHSYWFEAICLAGSLSRGSVTGCLETDDISATFVDITKTKSSIAMLLTNISFDATGYYAAFYQGASSTIIKGITNIIGNSSLPYTFTDLSPSSYYRFRVAIFDNAACSGTPLKTFTSDSISTNHRFNLITQIGSSTFNVWINPEDVDISSGWILYSILRNGSTIASWDGIFTNTESMPGLYLFSGLYLNTQYKLKVSVRTAQSGLVLDSYDSDFTTLNYTGRIRSTVDFNSITLEVYDLNFTPAAGYSTKYYLGTLVLINNGVFTNLDYDTSYSYYAEIVDTNNNIIARIPSSGTQSARTLKPMVYTLIPQTLSMNLALTNAVAHLNYATYSFTDGANTISGNINRATNILITGFAPETNYNYTLTGYTVGGTQIGEPITGTITTKSISGTLLVNDITNNSFTAQVSGINIIELGTSSIQYTCGIDTWSDFFSNNTVPSHTFTNKTGNTQYTVHAEIWRDGIMLKEYDTTITTKRDWEVLLSNRDLHTIHVLPTYHNNAYANYCYKMIFYHNSDIIYTTPYTSFTSWINCSPLLPKISGNYTYDIAVYPTAQGGTVIDYMNDVSYSPSAYDVLINPLSSDRVAFKLINFPSNYAQTVTVDVLKNGISVLDNPITRNIAVGDTESTFTFDSLLYGTYTIDYTVVWNNILVLHKQQSYTSSIFPIEFGLSSTHDTITVNYSSFRAQVAKVITTVNTLAQEATGPCILDFDYQLVANTTYNVYMQLYDANNNLITTKTVSTKTKVNGGYLNASNVDYDRADIILLNAQLTHTDNIAGYTVTYSGIGLSVTVPMSNILKGDKQNYTNLISDHTYNVSALLKYQGITIANFSTSFHTKTLYTLETSATSTTITAVFSDMPMNHKLRINASIGDQPYVWDRPIGQEQNCSLTFTGLTPNTTYTMLYTFTVDDVARAQESVLETTELYDYTLNHMWENLRLMAAVDNLTSNVVSTVTFRYYLKSSGALLWEADPITVDIGSTYTGYNIYGGTTLAVNTEYLIRAEVSEGTTTYTLETTAKKETLIEGIIELKYGKITGRYNNISYNDTNLTMYLDIYTNNGTTLVDTTSMNVPAHTVNTGYLTNSDSLDLIPNTNYTVILRLELNGSPFIAPTTKTFRYEFLHESTLSWGNNSVVLNAAWYKQYPNYYLIATLDNSSASQLFLFNLSTQCSLVFYPVNTAVQHSVRYTIYNSQGLAIITKLLTIRPTTVNYHITTTILNDLGQMSSVIGPISSDISQINWRISKGGSIVFESSVSVVAGLLSPSCNWDAESNSDYVIECFANGVRLDADYITTPLFNVGLSNAIINITPESTLISFSFEDYNSNYTYEYLLFKDGLPVINPTELETAMTNYAADFIVNLTPNTKYVLKIYCYSDQHNLVYTFVRDTLTKSRAHLLLDANSGSLEAWLTNMNHESGTVVFMCEGQISPAYLFYNSSISPSHIFPVYAYSAHTVSAEVWYDNGDYELLVLSIGALKIEDYGYDFLIINNYYPKLYLGSRSPTAYSANDIVNITIKNLADDTIEETVSQSFTGEYANYWNFSTRPGSYVLIGNITNNGTIKYDFTIYFTIKGEVIPPSLQAAGYDTDINVIMYDLKRQNKYTIVYTLIGDNVLRTSDTIIVQNTYTVPTYTFNNITEFGSYIVRAAYTINDNPLIHHVETAVVWDPEASIYGDSALKLIPSQFNTNNIAVEATGQLIDESTTYELTWEIFENGTNKQRYVRPYSSDMPHPYIVFNNMATDKRYDVYCTYTDTANSRTLKRRTNIYIGSLGKFDYIETNDALYITYNGPTNVHALLTITCPDLPPIITTLDNNETYKLEDPIPETEYVLEANINDDTTNYYLGSISDTYLAGGWAQIMLENGANPGTQINATIKKFRYDITKCYVKFTIRKTGSTGTTYLDGYLESLTYYYHYQTTNYPTHTFSNLTPGLDYTVSAEITVDGDYCGRGIAYHRTATVMPAAWSWSAKNGSWTHNPSETITSYNALTGSGNGRSTTLFFAEVWNDLCEKTHEVLDYLGEEWDETYASYEKTLMTNENGFMLKSWRYRSLWTQFINHFNTPNITYSNTELGDNVTSDHILLLASMLNDWIANATTAIYYSMEDIYLGLMIALWHSGSSISSFSLLNTNRNTAIDTGMIRGKKFVALDLNDLKTWLDYKKC